IVRAAVDDGDLPLTANPALKARQAGNGLERRNGAAVRAEERLDSADARRTRLARWSRCPLTGKAEDRDDETTAARGRWTAARRAVLRLPLDPVTKRAARVAHRPAVRWPVLSMAYDEPEALPQRLRCDDEAAGRVLADREREVAGQRDIRRVGVS